ncbi:histidine phosphatase family protein [Vibrio maerlii]|uniref:histidine phosphatase family protein n=1 Tax=Vibrio maerlii TaxID=2231648 RepID=UPI000E3C08FC|nr:histidine phosphatase family protein [Vibrio maerlii]
MRFILVRHGQTYWNIEHRLHGWLDSDITPSSRDLALNLSLEEYFIDSQGVVLFSSDLIRAKRTAELIAKTHQLPMECDQRLRERRFGLLQGEVINEKVNQHSEWLAYSNRYNLPLSGKSFGEEPEIEFVDRILSFLSDSLSNGSQTIVIVSHGEWIRTFVNLCEKRASWEFGAGIPNNMEPLIVDCSEEDIATLLKKHELQRQRARACT